MAIKSSSSANIDVDEIAKMKKALPVGKCIDMDMEIEGEKQGMLVCRTGDEEFTMKGKGDMSSMKGTIRVIDNPGGEE